MHVVSCEEEFQQQKLDLLWWKLDDHAPLRQVGQVGQTCSALATPASNGPAQKFGKRTLKNELRGFVGEFVVEPLLSSTEAPGLWPSERNRCPWHPDCPRILPVSQARRPWEGGGQSLNSGPLNSFQNIGSGTPKFVKHQH